MADTDSSASVNELKDIVARIAFGVLFAIAMGLFAAGVLWFFFGNGFGALMNSDAAVAGLLADEILRKRSLFPATWYYANGEIWTFSPQLFALPFVAAIGASTLALKLGNVTALCMSVGLVALPVRRVTRSWQFALIVATGLLACYSPQQSQMVYEQVAYAWFAAQFALLLYLALRIQGDAPGDGSALPPALRACSVVYVLVMINLGVDSPLRLLAYCVVPIVGACIVFPLSRRRGNLLIALSLLGMLASALLHTALLRHLAVIPGLSESVLHPSAQWLTDVSTVIDHLPSMVGSRGTGGAMTIAGFASLLRIGLFVSAAIAVVLSIPLGRWIEDPEARFFVRVAGAMLAVIAVVLVVGSPGGTPMSTRYLLPPAILSGAALMTVLWRACGAERPRVIMVAAPFVLAFAGGGAIVATRLGWRHALPECDGPARICELQSTLLQKGLHKGYATYWNANVTTLASGGAVKVCGVDFKRGISPFRWLVSKDCFDAPHDDRFFVALAQSESSPATRAAVIADVGAPDDIVSDGAFDILIFATAPHSTAWLAR